MKRREFIGACAVAGALGAPPVLAAADLKPRFYERVQLLDESKQPVRASRLEPSRNYIFVYPYESTPCFLLNLGRSAHRPVTLKTEAGAGYEWPGGVGRDNAIVSYSAICTHRLTYPTRQITFISYRDKGKFAVQGNKDVIHCCSEHSEYDPANGARVLGGPAPQPLAAILLEHDPKSDALFAVGTLGGEMFDAFFTKYDFKLALEYGGNRAKKPVGVSTVVTELDRYCKQQMEC